MTLSWNLRFCRRMSNRSSARITVSRNLHHKVQEVIQKIKRRTLTNRDEFDSNEEIINIENGLLNIHTRELKDHSPDFLSTIQLPVQYNPSARCPNILRFLGQVLHPQDVFTAMQIFGYILLKSSKFEKAFMLFGSGNNGKSVFIKLIESFVGRQNTSHVALQDLRWRSLCFCRPLWKTC